MEPRTPETGCERYAALAQDFVDGGLTDRDRADLDRHVAACPSCRALLADLQELARVAGDLPRHTPRPEVWSRIARRIADEQAGRPQPFWTGARVMLAMAATLVIAVSASVWLLRPSAPVSETPSNLVQDVDEHLRIAEAHYEKAIAGMQQIVTAEQGSLDPALAETLQKNMGVIDQAIRESREAIKTQPHSELVRTSLFEALRQKVALLEDTIALINVMRKGDQAGAARIITGLSKS